MSFPKLVITSIGFLACSSYVSYKYTKIKEYQSAFEKSNPREFLFKVHNENYKKIEKYISTAEKGSRISDYRKKLLSFTEGKVLETGVGSSRNLLYYPENVKVTAIDWARNVLELALAKPINDVIQIEYKIDDCEKMSFEDDVFDCVVDTFGLQYYQDPERAINEMKRVCKKNGKILLLENGRSFYDAYNVYLELSNPFYIFNYGYFENRPWEEIIQKSGLEIELKERKINGTIYFYVLKNKK